MCGTLRKKLETLFKKFDSKLNNGKETWNAFIAHTFPFPKNIKYWPVLHNFTSIPALKDLNSSIICPSGHLRVTQK